MGKSHNMVEELKKYLFHLLKITDGLHAIIISDRDGVPVIKVCTDPTPELSTRPKFLSTFGMVTEQASKLGLSNNRSLVSVYGTYQVVCLNKLPLIVTMIATSEANTGVILGLEHELSDTLEEVKKAVGLT